MSSAPAGAGSCAFDELAANYDDAFTRSSVGCALRRTVWGRLAQTFSRCRSILELGCGTGEDAIQLARAGAQVVAVDSSRQMLQRAAAKADGANCAGQIEFHCLPMEEVGGAFAGREFDGVLSNFGAVNCVPDLSALAASIAARLAPGSPLLWIVLGRYVPWEWAWYLARGDSGRAFRRLHAAGAQWRGLTIRYPTPHQLSKLLAPEFSIQRLSPLGFALPPSYAAGWVDRFPRALRGLERIEALAQSSSALASVADHFMIEAVRSNK